MKTKHAYPPHEYVVAVTRGHRTRYGYGSRLKDAVARARVRTGDVFTYWRMKRQKPVVAELAGLTYHIFTERT